MGVTSAGIEPKNMNLPLLNASFLWKLGRRSRPDKERGRKMSSMWRAAVILPVLLATAPFELGAICGAGRILLQLRAVLARERRLRARPVAQLRQSSGYSFADYARS